MKKVLLSLGALAVALAVVPMFAAFEAHVINVTATIENALEVPVRPIQFGTVFPQEYLKQNLPVALSRSFMAENRVDDVEYIIRQKPKCAWSWQDAAGVWHIDENSTQTGHVMPGNNLATPEEEAYWIDCGKPQQPQGVPTTATWGMLPMLCPYISKHEVTDDLTDPKSPGLDNDSGLSSFHHPFMVDATGVHWTDTKGRLSKMAADIADNWIIDLAVPCFGGYCAQDWLDFVRKMSGTNMTLEEAMSYTQPIANEHKVFGCDLWVEVTGVSRNPVSPTGI